MNDSQIPQEWFDKGNRDIETAELLDAHNHYPSIICFHVQQAIEKYLKGYLHAKGVTPRKTHDLVELISSCATLNVDFGRFTDLCDKLSGYYLESRYPMPSLSEPTKQEVQEFIKIAKAIVTLVTEKFE